MSDITATQIDELKANGYVVNCGATKDKMWWWATKDGPDAMMPTFSAAVRAAWEHYQASKRPAKPQCYTIDTFPTGEVWVRRVKLSPRSLVLWAGHNGIEVKHGGIPYQTLADVYELSTDGGITWRPAKPE